MTKQEYLEIESFMLEKMSDSAHDKMHIYRVLSMALEIAGHEQDADYDILIAASLLHDIGREMQFADASLDHAIIGGEMAYEYLISRGWPDTRAAQVKACIREHRYRESAPPSSIEAKILFDSDKLDVSGAIGIARTFLYKGVVSAPIYELDDSGDVKTHAGNSDTASFFEEFNYKLRHIYGSFHTTHAKAVAEKRAAIALAFYDNLLAEVQSAHAAINGIDDILERFA